MTHRDADRNLLFGISALQNDFITRDALIAAMNAWALEKHRPLGDILLEKGALDLADYEALNALIARRLVKQGHDPERRPNALNSAAGLAESLRRSIVDPEVLESISRFSSKEPPDPHATRTADMITYIPVGTRYRKLRDHAQGGLGIVYVAHDEELHREVALKEIKAQFAHNLDSQSRFLMEAEITGGLEHPGIVPVYGLGHHEDGRPYYAMRFIRGNSLKEAIELSRETNKYGRDPSERAAAIRGLLKRFVDVCQAVSYAHSRGILHRDLKPSNIMLGPFGETLVVDWGLAKTLGRADGSHSTTAAEETLRPPSSSKSSQTQAGSLIGTPSYMSPEQAQGDHGKIGPASDVYSLGATMYHLLTGRAPFELKTEQGDSLETMLNRVRKGEFPTTRELDPTISPVLEITCLRAMETDPQDRPDSPLYLAEAIENWMVDEPVSAFYTAVADYERFVEEHPEKPKYLEGLARSRTDLGNALSVLGRVLESEAEYRQAILEYRKLIEMQSPENTNGVMNFREAIARNYSKLGRVLTAAGRVDDARESYRASYEEYQILSQFFPEAIDLQADFGLLAPALAAGAEVARELLLPEAIRADETSRDLYHAIAASPDGILSLAGARFKVFRHLTSDSLGDIYVAEDEFEREVAVKRNRSANCDNPYSQARLRLEAEVMAKLEHPSIPPIYGLGLNQNGQPFFAMRLISGETLDNWIRRFHQGGVKSRKHFYDPHFLVVLNNLIDTCKAISYAHSRGIIHRNLKPSVIMRCRNGETQIVDWSLVLPLNPADWLVSSTSPYLDEIPGNAIGTPPYMSPEQAQGRIDLMGPSSDVYGLGAILFNIITGRAPCEGSP